MTRVEEDDVLETSKSTFHAACMLVDISGFSSFSGSMCSKGVVGLDDLHKATDGFLGHFVDVVHMYDGDVICFAGNLLIYSTSILSNPSFHPSFQAVIIHSS